MTTNSNLTKKDETEVHKLRRLAACMYQFAGSHDAPEVWLDVLSKAAAGRPFSTGKLLPYLPKKRKVTE